MPSPSHRDRHLEPRTPRIVHLDVDAFLASVEQALHPELRGKPVVVGGLPNERNIVMACSYEARAFGVRSGMLLREVQRLCPQALFRRGDSQAANHLRDELTRVLLEFSPRVEVASIDDFFVDLTGTRALLGAAVDVAVLMRQHIRERTQLPVTIGIGTNRLLARLAGKLAKPGGVGEILPGAEGAVLERWPLAQLPGGARAIGAQLAALAVHTAGELARVPREYLFARFGHPGLVLHAHARGLDATRVERTHALDGQGLLVVRLPRSIRRESTFEPEEARIEAIEAMLAYLVERASAKLRLHRALARSVEVEQVYVDTRSPAQRRATRSEDDPTSSVRRRALAAPSDSTDALTRHALELLRSLPQRRALVKRVRVSLLELHESPGWQGQLFDAPQAGAPAVQNAPEQAARSSHADRQRQLDRVLDELRARHGFGRILRATSLPLAQRYPLGRDGFELRTPSLNQ